MSSAQLSERDRSTWELFADWCFAVGEAVLPASPELLARFLAANPASPRTQRRRVAVVNAVHRDAGYRPPGVAEVVRASIDRLRIARRCRLVGCAALAAQRLPGVDRWPANLFGHRDLAVLVLATSGIQAAVLARATAGDIAADEGQLYITTPREQFATDHGLSAHSVDAEAVLGRWLAVRALQHHIPSPTSPAALLRDDGPPAVPALPDHAPLFTPLDSWGSPPLDAATPITPQTIAQILRAHLAGTVPRRRQRPTPTPALTESPRAGPTDAIAPPVLDPAVWSRGLEARHQAHAELADVDDTLSAVEAEAERLNALLQLTLDDTSGGEAEAMGNQSTDLRVQ